MTVDRLHAFHKEQKCIIFTHIYTQLKCTPGNIVKITQFVKHVKHLVKVYN